MHCTPLPTCVHTHTLTCTHTRAHRTSPSRKPGHVARAPHLPGPGSAASPHPPALHVGAPRRQAAALPTEPLAGPRGGREGAAPGSDGQSGRPIEPRTASPKGGSGGSDGPNERGARVGLPPGIPLARIAGPWVTRKLGGRRRRPRLGSPVSDTGPPSPQTQRGQPAPAHPPTRAGRARRRRLEPRPFVGRVPPPFGGNKVAQREPLRGGGERPGRDSERRRGQPSQKVGRRKKGRRRLGTGAGTVRSEVCGGPLAGPGHSRRASLAKVWRPLPRRRRWLRAPRRAGAERAPLPLGPRFCVSRLLLMLRPATSCGGRC